MKTFAWMVIVAVLLTAWGVYKVHKVVSSQSKMSLLIMDDATRADRAYALASK